jgi:hypothetical protein
VANEKEPYLHDFDWPYGIGHPSWTSHAQVDVDDLLARTQQSAATLWLDPDSIANDIYIYIYICVCVCVCVRAHPG